MKKRKIATALFALLITLTPITTLAEETDVNVSSFGVLPQTADCTPGIISCIAACQGKTDVVIKFTKGTYHFYPDFAKDKYCFVSNNDEGLKRVVFPLDDFKNITIDGGGSSFIFHGFTNPFTVYNSSGVTFKNFSIDFARPFHSEAIILANNQDGIDVEITESFPFTINNGILVFNDFANAGGKQTTVSSLSTYPYGHLLEFNTQKRETAYMAKDYYLNGTPLHASSLGGRKVRIFLDGLKGTVGNTMVFGAATRNHPGFIVSDCSDVEFHNVTIFSACGVGFLAQRTHNVKLDSCRVVPSGTRMVSTTADATHFVNCTGKIELGNSTFTNQLDDATNIHGIYVQIAKQMAADEILVRLVHPQQYGFDFLKKGENIEFVQGRTLVTKGTATVIEAQRINKNYTQVKLSTPLPEGIAVGDALCEVRDFPEIYIHDNYIGKNRARGMLLNCRGKTVVERNVFHTPGAAIMFEGDACYWFEQGGVSDCTIRDNKFEDCLFGVWGTAVIDVQAGIKDGFEASRYNKNINVSGNTFKTFDGSLLLHAYCVDNLTWKNNKVAKDTAYPAARSNNEAFKVEYSNKIDITQGRYKLHIR